MRILILNQILYTADNNTIPVVSSIKDTMIYNMCLGFVDAGHTVTLAAAEDYKPKAIEAYDFEVRFFATYLPRLLAPSIIPFSPALYRFIKKERDRFDLVISSEVFSFQSLFASILCPRKTLIWQEQTAHQKKFRELPSKIWYRTIVPLFLTKVSRIVPRSKRAYDFISSYAPNVSDIIVDHGINVGKFTFSKKKERTIISSSQLIYRKNIEGIIRVFDSFTRMKGYEDIRLLIAGRGYRRPVLENLVAELGLQEKIQFLGFLSQAELNRHIKKSYCFLVNTRQDLNMVSIPEAIVSGTPILTNTQPASVEYIRANGLGIVKDNWDEYDLKKIVDENPDYVQNCIAYRDKLTNTHAARTFLNIYRNL